MDLTIIETLSAYGREPYRPRPEGFGITAAEYAERVKCSLDSARDFLNRAVEEGILEAHLMAAPKGGKIKVYHRPGDWPPKTDTDLEG